MIENKFILIGYSGHAYVVHNILESTGKKIFAYCDAIKKESNPFELNYIGTETSEEGIELLSKNCFFISIGNNNVRRKVYKTLAEKSLFSSNAVHVSAILCKSVFIHPNAVMISAGVIINPLTKIGMGSICNTGCIIEHECTVGDFSHIGPGTVLCGNVTVGENSFVGAGSVVRQGITIGKNVVIGAGSVVVKDIPDNRTVMGCPAK
jgi:sugar O-acyltransferase (sialic acid O-acetyltransferase NeuD family)